MLQHILASAHDLIGERVRADSKIRPIIGQRIIDLAVSDPVRHHNVGRRMGLREHILDLLARPDIPVRDSGLLHGFLEIVCKPFSFSYFFHNGKG